MRKRTALICLSLMTALVPVSSALDPAQAKAHDMFPSKAAAEQRARQLQCSGAFAMGREWMPCKDITTYEKALQKQSR